MKLNELQVVYHQVHQALSIGTELARQDNKLYEQHPGGMIGFLSDCVMHSLGEVMTFDVIDYPVTQPLTETNNVTGNPSSETNSTPIGGGERPNETEAGQPR